MMNGWHSIWSPIKPGHGEQVLTLSYEGPRPAPPEPFADKENRFYNTPFYFYPGDTEVEEVLGDKAQGIPGGIQDVTFDEEGFYSYDPDPDAGWACRWRRLATADMIGSGIICWKELDWPDDEPLKEQ